MLQYGEWNLNQKGIFNHDPVGFATTSRNAVKDNPKKLFNCVPFLPTAVQTLVCRSIIFDKYLPSFLPDIAAAAYVCLVLRLVLGNAPTFPR